MNWNIDWSAVMDQATQSATQYWGMAAQHFALVTQSCDQLTHWLLNDGSAFSAFLIFLAVGCAVISYAARGQKKQLWEYRAGYDVECFVREMTAAGYDAEVCRTVYYYIEDRHRIDFPILPTDDLYTVLGVTDETIQRAMPELMQATGREPRIGRLMKQLTTVEDLVRFVDSAPLTTEYVWEMQTA
jgi:hypothetical protein